MDMVSVHHLKKYYGKGENLVKALDGMDLTIEKGKFTAIIGASGSGKTTLLNMIGGLDVPDEGEVIVDGVNLSGLREKELAVFRRSKVGFVYQNFNLVSTLTVRENILFPLSLAGSPRTPPFSVRSWACSACRTGWTPFRGSSPAAGSSGWPLPGPSSPSPPFSWQMSPPATWTPRAARTCWASSSCRWKPTTRRW